MSASWYVACRFTRSRLVAGEHVVTATSVAHAKQVGGMSTACGESASTMAKLFELRFPVEDGENCPRCLVVVAEHASRTRRRGGTRTS